MNLFIQVVFIYRPMHMVFHHHDLFLEMSRGNKNANFKSRIPLLFPTNGVRQVKLGWSKWCTILFAIVLIVMFACVCGPSEPSASPAKDNYRMNRYKNKALNPEEMRRRREEEGIQLRKQKREQQVAQQTYPFHSSDPISVWDYISMYSMYTENSFTWLCLCVLSQSF